MTRGLHWFRNDLRLRDNTALNELLARSDEWLPVFVLDPRLMEGECARAPREALLERRQTGWHVPGIHSI